MANETGGVLMSSPDIKQLESTSPFEELMFSEFPGNGKSNLNKSAQQGETTAEETVRVQKSFSHGLSQRISAEAMASYYQISGFLDTRDMVSLNFLIQSSIADSKGFHILSDEELQNKKRELEMNKSRVIDLEYKLSLERKMKDAAMSLSKYHLSGNGESTLSGNVPGSPPSTKPSIFSSKKRLSKQAMDEAEVSARRIMDIQTELDEISSKVHKDELELLQHSIGILSLTHPGSNSMISKSYLHAVETKGTPMSEISAHGLAPAPVLASTSAATLPSAQQPQPAQLESEDVVPSLNRGMSTWTNLSRGMSTNLNRGMSTKSNLSRGMSLKSNLNMEVSETIEDEKLESLILTISSVMPLEKSPGPLPSTRKKLDHLEEITRNLVREYVTTDSAVREKDTELAELKGTINKVVSEFDPAMKTEDIDASKPAELLINVTNSYKSKTMADNENLMQTISMLEMMQSSNGDLDTVTEANKKTQIKKLQESYESNRVALEKLELENIDLQNNLKEMKLTKDDEVERLNTELNTSKERVEEWKERSDAIREELESVLKSLEDLTRQTVEYESERTHMEATIAELQGQVLQATHENVDKRMSRVGPESRALGSDGIDTAKGPVVSLLDPTPTTATTSSTAGSLSDPPMSVVILQYEFRKILHDVNLKHSAALLKEQAEKKKMQSLLRSYKGLSSMAAANAAAAAAATSANAATMEDTSVVAEPRLVTV